MRQVPGQTLNGLELTAPGIAGALRDARRRTLEIVADLDDEQMMGPRLAIVNPLLWEIGHLAWFQELWALRHLRGEAPILEHGERLYDSAVIPHDTRWDLSLPSRADTLELMSAVLNKIQDHLARAGDGLSDEEIYFHLLALFHEQMHAEAFLFTRQTLSYPPPRLTGLGAVTTPRAGAFAGDAELPGGHFSLGADRDLPFVFDNEKWAHPVDVAPFAMARAPVTQGEFAGFVDDRGYERRELWSTEGWAWRVDAGAVHPVYWERGAGAWSHRVWDAWRTLEDPLPMIHVNWFEASAYCRWAGRRLPTEAEWELAASGEPSVDGHSLGGKKRGNPWDEDAPGPEHANLDMRWGGPVPVAALPDGDSAFGCRQMTGNVWEWTADAFGPFPGFVADPYKEYSEPWFGTQKVLRGGCWATRSSLIRNTWRNFYTPDRRDVWAGFRTCAT